MLCFFSEQANKYLQTSGNYQIIHAGTVKCSGVARGGGWSHFLEFH